MTARRFITPHDCPRVYNGATAAADCGLEMPQQPPRRTTAAQYLSFFRRLSAERGLADKFFIETVEDALVTHDARRRTERAHDDGVRTADVARIHGDVVGGDVIDGDILSARIAVGHGAVHENDAARPDAGRKLVKHFLVIRGGRAPRGRV